LSKKESLIAFIKALRDNGILDFNIDNFNHRLKLQKYVFIARKFGLDLGYKYNLYLRGPYSPLLAEDYYAIKEGEVTPKSIELDGRFVELIKNKSARWLELASTIIMIRDRYRISDPEGIISLMRITKPYATKHELLEIISELKKLKIV